MDYKLSIYFTNGKDLTIVRAEKEFINFLVEMEGNKPHFNEDKKSGFGVPMYNVVYYTFIEYTEEMKKEDADRIKQSQEIKNEKNIPINKEPTTTKDEAKEIKESK